MNREFLMLAKNLETNNTINGFYASIKLDGQRCFWDGGISRGLLKARIPWANNRKDGRYKEAPISTGLWSRYGNVIHAPEWFLDQLPKGIFLDGELFLGRGKFQECRSIISTLKPEADWHKIRYHVFDIPSPSMVFTLGRINNPNFEHHIDENACMEFVGDMDRRVLPFYRTVQKLFELYESQKTAVWKPLTQTQLPNNEIVAKERLQQMLETETLLGGEGIMLRQPGSLWHPKRVDSLLKVKKLEIDEGTVVGLYFGEGKLLGMMGSLVVKWGSHTFQLSGFTDVERHLKTTEAMSYAMKNPGCKAPDWIDCGYFAKGAKIRFTYRTLTDEGIPREARYLR